MRTQTLMTVAVLAGLVCGNYLSQFFGAENYAVALERSWFQAVAVAAVLVANRAVLACGGRS